MARYEFKFVVTDVELSEEARVAVDRAVALAGTSALGAALPADAVTAPLVSDEYVRGHWIGIPASVDVPPNLLHGVWKIDEVNPPDPR